MPAQVRIIHTVNQFFNLKNIPIQFNEGGVCAGLAAVFVRYSLENKEQDFFRICRKLANLSQDAELLKDSELISFIREIEIHFNRFKYTGDSRQAELQDRVFIKGESLKKEFNLGLVTHRQNWASILETLYAEGRSCMVQSHNHTIAMSFKNGQYIIYDPNYNVDQHAEEAVNQNNSRSFLTAQEAIDELGRQFFYDANSSLGIGIYVYAHPQEQIPCNYPDKKTILESCYQKDTDFKQISYENGQPVSLTAFGFAADNDDLETVEFFFANNQVDYMDPILNRLFFNEQYKDLLISKLNDIPNDALITWLYMATLIGNVILVKELIAATATRSISINELFTKELLCSSVELKCNTTIIKLLFDYYIQAHKALPTEQSDTFKTMLSHISKNGHSDALALFTGDYYTSLTADTIKEAIKYACIADNRESLNFWLLKWNDHPYHEVKSLIDFPEMVEHILLINFKTLLENNFQPTAELLPVLMKRREPEFFELTVQKFYPRLKDFLVWACTEKVNAETINLHEVIDANVTAWQLLIYSGKNELIKKNWPASQPDFAKQALKFACDCGNRDIVTFLTLTGHSIDPQIQISGLNEAIKSGNEAKIRTYLDVAIKGKGLLFNKENRSIVLKLIKTGHDEFILSAWDNLPSTNRIEYLKVAMAYNNPLAERLGDTQIYALFENEILSYKEKMHTRDTKDDPDADKKFRIHARKDISIPLELLKRAIKFHQFNFAENLKFYIDLTIDEQLELFIDAHMSNNKPTMDFLLSAYRSLLDNETVYSKLEEYGHYDLLIPLLQQESRLSSNYKFKLLKHAVARKDEPLIKVLMPYINEAYKEQGSSLYQALQENNLDGVHLLLKYGAVIRENDSFVPSMLLTKGDVSLLQAAWTQKNFRNYIEKNLIDILKDARPATALFLFQVLPVKENINLFLQYALQKDDAVFFKKLLSTAEIRESDKKVLFIKACEHRAPGCVNELLAEPIPFDNEEQIEKHLDLLFWGEDKELAAKHQDANDIYELVYPKALYRLYEFLKEKQYRPFAALNSSIDKMLFDSAFNHEKKSDLRNYLLERVLDEGDADKLAALMEQLKTLPALDEKGLELFNKNLDNPILLRVLLEKYNLNDVLNAAIDQKEWLTILSLLDQRKVNELDSTTLEKLQEQERSILSALAKKAKEDIVNDPRQALNQLLSTTASLALAHVLGRQKKAIKDLITDIQDQMIKEKIDLKMHFYEFSLYDSIVKEALNDAVDAFIEENDAKGFKEIYEDKNAFLTLTAIRDEIAKHDLLEEDILNEQFRRLLAYLTEFEKTGEFPDDSRTIISMTQAQTAEEEPQPQEEAQLLEEVHQPQEEAQLLEEVHQPQEIDPVDSVESSSLNQLKELVSNYRTQREKGRWTNHYISFFQYTKKDKLTASEILIQAINVDNKLINTEIAKVLNDGSLATQLNGFIDDHQVNLKSELTVNQLESINDLIAALNQKNVINAFIKELKDYRQERNENPLDTYHFKIFNQFSKEDKISAVDLFIELLENGSNSQAPQDLSALKQGSLGKRINKFLAENRSALSQAIGADKIVDLDELIEKLKSRERAQPTAHL